MSNPNVNVIYLFGAGASATAKINNHKSFEIDESNLMHSVINQAFPLADNFLKKSKDLLEFIAFLKREIGKHKDNVSIISEWVINAETELNDVIKDLNELGQKIDNFKTIDEAAKFYFINDKAIFDKIKNIINKLLFTIETTLDSTDTRFPQLLITLFEKEIGIPPNIQFVSWNFDNQFEKACKLIDPISKYNLSDNLYKLNGSISMGLKETSNIQFAWEDREIPVIQKPKNNNYNILVSIGYSFPYVNRLIDNAFFNKYKFNKVYIQDIKIENTFLDNFKKRYNIATVEWVENCNRFYIPSELMYGNEGLYRFA